MVGVNDACTSRVDDLTTVRQFRAGIDAGLAKLKKGLPKSRVLVASLSDVHRLWRSARTTSAPSGPGAAACASRC